MDVTDGVITALEIVNAKTGKLVFRKGSTLPEIKTEEPVISEAMFNVIRDKCKAKGKSLKAILQLYGRESPKEMLVTEWKESIERLEALPDVTA